MALPSPPELYVTSLLSLFLNRVLQTVMYAASLNSKIIFPSTFLLPNLKPPWIPSYPSLHYHYTSLHVHSDPHSAQPALSVISKSPGLVVYPRTCPPLRSYYPVVHMQILHSSNASPRQSNSPSLISHQSSTRLLLCQFTFSLSIHQPLLLLYLLPCPSRTTISPLFCSQ
jgi:hypothetical protein